MARQQRTPNVGGKLNKSEKPTNDGMKLIGARLRDRSNENDRPNNGGSKPSKSARLRDSVSGNESSPRTNPKRMIGGAFSKSRAMLAWMKFVVPTAVRYSDAILIG